MSHPTERWVAFETAVQARRLHFMHSSEVSWVPDAGGVIVRLDDRAVTIPYCDGDSVERVRLEIAAALLSAFLPFGY